MSFATWNYVFPYFSAFLVAATHCRFVKYLAIVSTHAINIIQMCNFRIEVLVLMTHAPKLTVAPAIA